jgi:hypothetical protein
MAKYIQAIGLPRNWQNALRDRCPAGGEVITTIDALQRLSMCNDWNVGGSVRPKHQWADNLGLGHLLSERQLDFAAGPILFQAVIDDGIWNRGSNEFGACAKLVRGLNRRPIVLFPLDGNRSITSQPSDGNNA